MTAYDPADFLDAFAPTGGPWTRHGHDIPGVTVAGDGGPDVARCGGPTICRECNDDARRLQAEATA